MKDNRRVIPFKRKRSGKTNYKKRIAYLTSGMPRLVIRKSLNNIIVQIIVYEPKGDRVLASATSREIKKLGWNLAGSNTPASYLVGYIAGKKAVAAKITDAILDLGLYRPISGSKVYAALKGAVDAGLRVPHDESIIPKQDRLQGKHISEYRKIDVKKQFDEIMEKIKGKQ